MIFAISASNNLQSRLCLRHHSTLFSALGKSRRKQNTSPSPTTEAPSVDQLEAISLPLAPKTWSTFPLHQNWKQADIPGYRHMGLMLSPTNGKKKQTVKGYSVCFFMSYHALIDASERIQVGLSREGRRPQDRWDIHTKGMVPCLFHPCSSSLWLSPWPVPSWEAILLRQYQVFSSILPADKITVETVSSNVQKEQQNFSNRRGLVSVAIQDDQI